MRKKPLVEVARELGISVAALKQRLKQEREQNAIDEARRALSPKSAGWNPRAGNKRRQKD